MLKVNGNKLPEENKILDQLPVSFWYDQITSSHNHTSFTKDHLEAQKSLDNIKNRLLNETTSVQAIYQDEQSKFIKSNKGNLDLNEVAKVFP